MKEGWKICLLCYLVSKNIKERPAWRVIKCDSVEFKNILLYRKY